MIELREAKVFPDYIDAIEKSIIQIMKKFYEDLIGGKVIKNSLDDLDSAIIDDKIFYDGSKFIGRFTSALSKELIKLGAKWDKKNRAWKISLAKLPISTKNAISHAKILTENRVSAMLARLSASEVPPLEADRVMTSVVEKIEKDIDKTMANVPTVSTGLGDAEKLEIRKKYIENLKLDIKNWHDSEVIKLRKRVNQRVEKGIRYGDLIKSLQQDYGLSARKAKFIARQETHLLVAEMKEQQYTSAGISRYKWKTLNYPVGDNPRDVRPDHARLDGKIFEWKNPPIVNTKTGKRGNPQTDYNCRCIAIPVWDGD